MALNALGIQTTEDEVNKVLGARPMKGASWEQVLAAAQHFGCRATLTMPATLTQIKEWTDAGVPVLIAWNPEGREWSHASVIFDVVDGPLEALDGTQQLQDGDGPGRYVFVADPNLPNPEKLVRIVHEDEFYRKWYEKWPDYLVRRPAVAIEREITPEGRQVMASAKSSGRLQQPGSPGFRDWAEGYMEDIWHGEGLEAKTLPHAIEMYAWDLGYQGQKLEPWFIALGKIHNLDVRREHRKGLQVAPKYARRLERKLSRQASSESIADQWLSAKKRSQPVTQKKDKSKATGKAPKPRNKVVQDAATRGWGSGSHGGGKRTKNRRDRQKTKRELRNP
jgi:hypothetical protein